MIKLFFGSLLGGLLAFALLFASWTLMPHHKQNLHQFADETAVVSLLRQQIGEDGIYVIPATMKAEAVQEGPFVFAAVRTGPKPGYDFLTLLWRMLSVIIVSGFILGIMLHFAAPRLNYLGRVMFVTLGGVLIALMGIYPFNVWWELPVSFILMNMIDSVASWFAGGLAMACIINGARRPIDVIAEEAAG